MTTRSVIKQPFWGLTFGTVSALCRSNLVDYLVQIGFNGLVPPELWERALKETENEFGGKTKEKAFPVRATSRWIKRVACMRALAHGLKEYAIKHGEAAAIEKLIGLVRNVIEYCRANGMDNIAARLESHIDKLETAMELYKNEQFVQLMRGGAKYSVRKTVIEMVKQRKKPQEILQAIGITQQAAATAPATA